MALKDQLTRPTPLYAAVGLGDAVVAGVRATVPSAEDVDESARQLRALPDHVRHLPEQAQAWAVGVLDDIASTYAGLAERGEGLVSRVRGQKATQDLERQAATAKSQAKGAATTAKRSAKRTASAAKGAATSARKTADAAAKAASDAADKTGR